MADNELNRLKYEIYKKSWLKDYLTFKQFVENQDVAKTFWELQKRKSIKIPKKDLKLDRKKLQNRSNM